MQILTMNSVLSAARRIQLGNTLPQVIRGTTIIVLLIIINLGSCASRAVAQEGNRSRFSGRVITVSNTPIPQVEVTVLPLGKTILTDSTGRFFVEAVAPGSYTVRFRRPGFASELLSLELGRDEKKNVTVVMEARAFSLPEVETRAAGPLKPVEYAHTHKYDAFFARKKVGLGAYITRAEIDRLRPLDTARLVSLAPGVTLFFSRDQADVRIRGCERIGVWIDGIKQRYAEFYRPPRNERDEAAIAAGYFLSQLIPSRVEMVEVYRGPAEMPAEFLPDECAIVVWTR